MGRGDAVLYPCARLEVVYPGAGGRLRAGQGDDIAVKDGDRYAIVRRDRAREAGFLETLREAARPHAWSEGERLRHPADATSFGDDGAPQAIIDWKSDVDPRPETVEHYRAQVQSYLRMTGLTKGLIVFVTHGTVVQVS